MEFMLALSMLELAVAFQPPVLGGPHRGMRLRAASQKPCALEMQAGAPVDRRTLLAAPVGFALASLSVPAPASAKPSEATLKKAESIKAAILKICKAGSTGPVPTEDVVFAIIDDGSPDVDAAFYGAAASGGQAVRLKYDPKGGVKQRQKIQEEYQEKGCQCVIAPNTASIFDLMQGNGLECTNCGYGGAAPPRWFIVLDDKGKTNKEMSGEAGTTGWGCFDDKLGLVPGNVFTQKVGDNGIKKCGPYGIQLPVVSLKFMETAEVKEGEAFMAVPGVSFGLDELFPKK